MSKSRQHDDDAHRLNNIFSLHEIHLVQCMYYVNSKTCLGLFLIDIVGNDNNKTKITFLKIAPYNILYYRDDVMNKYEGHTVNTMRMSKLKTNYSARCKQQKFSREEVRCPIFSG